jgi:hypothetical protein
LVGDGSIAPGVLVAATARRAAILITVIGVAIMGVTTVPTTATVITRFIASTPAISTAIATGFIT